MAEAEAQDPPQDPFELFVLRPEDIDPIWNSEDPKASVMQKVRSHIKLIEEADPEFNRHTEFEDRYEPPELSFLANFFLHNMVFLKEDL